MFTGIISDVGEVVHVSAAAGLRRFRIACAYDPAGIDIGASIAHAGICLTVIAKGRADHQEGAPHPVLREQDGAPHPVLREQEGAPHPVLREQEGAPHPVLNEREGAPHPVLNEREGAPHPVQGWYDVEAAAETLRLTNAAQWQLGTKLNLERALKMGDELGGHMVTGHVDGLAEIVARDEVTPEDANWGATARFTLRAPRPLHRYIAAKGSVTLDGTSLTVNTVEDDCFSVLLIPHTLKVTTWGGRKAGDSVHLEIDIMARYAARLAETA